MSRPKKWLYFAKKSHLAKEELMRNAPTGTILGSYLISPNQEEPDFLKSFKASRFDKGKARGQPLKLVLEKMGLNHL